MATSCPTGYTAVPPSCPATQSSITSRYASTIKTSFFLGVFIFYFRQLYNLDFFNLSTVCLFNKRGQSTPDPSPVPLKGTVPQINVIQRSGCNCIYFSVPETLSLSFCGQSLQCCINLRGNYPANS